MKTKSDPQLRWFFPLASGMLVVLVATLHSRTTRQPLTIPAQPTNLLIEDASTTAETGPHSSSANGIRSSSPPKHQVWKHPEQAPAWTVGYGAEFWRKARPAARVKAKPGPEVIALPSSMNLGDVIE